MHGNALGMEDEDDETTKMAKDDKGEWPLLQPDTQASRLGAEKRTKGKG